MDYYLKRGKCYRKTIRQLGYPPRDTLRKWVEEIAPDERKIHQRRVEYTQEQKIEAVAAFKLRDTSAESVADKLGLSRVSLYKWHGQLLPGEKESVMANKPDHELPDEKDALIGEADQPNEKWLTDITEFSIPAGKVYLSPIIDCFDGLVVSWTIATHPTAEMANTMLDKAACSLQEDEHPIIHSDRGGHYRWPGWIGRVNTYGLV